MFINISNHPSSKWSEKQLNTALLFGEIVDIPFPDVNPKATTNDILNMARDIVVTVSHIQLAKNRRARLIHLVGEPTLTVAAVTLLIKYGYDVCTSTTKRISKENPDGTITKSFEFCSFRFYSIRA